MPLELDGGLCERAVDGRICGIVVTASCVRGVTGVCMRCEGGAGGGGRYESATSVIQAAGG